MISNNNELRGHIKYIESQLKGVSDDQWDKLEIRVFAMETAWRVLIAMQSKFSHGFAIQPQLMPRALSESTHQLADKISLYVERLNATSSPREEEIDDWDVQSDVFNVEDQLNTIRNIIAYLAVCIVFTPGAEITIEHGFWDQVDAGISQFEE